MIYVFGDSHSGMFNVSHRKDRMHENVIFDVLPQAVELDGFSGFVDMASSVPLAYSLAKHNDVIMKELGAIPFKDGDEMWFIFGEIDVRYHIFYWHQELGITLDQSIENVVSKYIAYVKNLRELGYNIHIVSVAPPQPTCEAMNPVRGDGITVDDRIYMTETLNRRLQEECGGNGIPFRDVYPYLMDPETRCNIPEMTYDGMHYCYIGDMIAEDFGL